MIAAKAPVAAEPLTRARALRQLMQAFAAAGLETPALDARLILCAALAIDHASLVRDPDVILDAQGMAAVEALSKRRLAHEPVSRILGKREFWGMELALDAAVLDPRPDTETLIDAVLAHVDAQLNARRDTAWRVLDLGTGSGAILAALLTVLPQARGVGVDLSPRAAATAKANLARLGLAGRGFVVCGDWAAALRGRFDIIVANPPYIATRDIGDLAPEVRDHDPHLALDGGADGLAAYRALAPAAARLLAPAGLAAFECGAGQAHDVAALLQTAGLLRIGMRSDLAGHLRIVTAEAP